ncbi:hypothetical protein KI387_040793, partial [Taxus chinensis]
EEKKKKNIVIFDLRGGTFDVSVVRVWRHKIEVKAVGGDTHLGGEDLNNMLLNYCIGIFNHKYKIDMRSSGKAFRRLHAECMMVKRNLSTAVETVIEIDCLYQKNDLTRILRKRAMREACKIARLNTMHIINEPTAAAISYGSIMKEEKKKKNIVLFDLGGGTFDVSVVRVRRHKIEVKAVGGDTHLGGEDFNKRLLDYCVGIFNHKYKIDMRSSSKAFRRLRAECVTDMKTKERNQIVINCNESETRTIGKEEVDRLVAWARRFRMKDEVEEERIVAKYEFQRYIRKMKIRVNEARTRGNIGENVAQDIILTLNSYQQWLQNHSPSPSPHKLRHKFCELQEKCGNALKNGRGKFCKLPDVWRRLRDKFGELQDKCGNALTDGRVKFFKSPDLWRRLRDKFGELQDKYGNFLKNGKGKFFESPDLYDPLIPPTFC